MWVDNRSWHFIVHPNNRWSWQRLNEDGSLNRVSAITGEFGKLMSDALLHGFNPDGHRWVVWDRKWRTYYAPGVEPILMPRTSTHAQMTASGLGMDEQPGGDAPSEERATG